MSSNAGLFLLSANDGKLDKILMGTEVLTSRIKQLAAAGTTVTAADVVRTHMVFTYSSFKPFVPFSFCYQYMNPSQNIAAISVSAGSQQELVFQYPQPSDYICDSVVLTKIGAITDATNYTLPSLNVLEVPTWKIVDNVSGAVVYSVTSATPVTASNAAGVNALSLMLDLATRDALTARAHTVAGAFTAVTPWADSAALAAVQTRRDVLGAATGVADLGHVVDGSMANQVGSVVSPNSAFFRVEMGFTTGVLDSDGSVVPLDTQLTNPKHKPWLRYCDMPGHKLLTSVQFAIDNQIVDQYSNHTYRMFEKTQCKVDEHQAYLRMVGQDDCQEYKCAPLADGRVLKGRSLVPGGNQTPSANGLAATEFYSPLKFWFSDPAHALPVAAIPYADRKVTIRLDGLSGIVDSVATGQVKIHSVVRTFHPAQPGVARDVTMVAPVLKEHYNAPSLQLNQPSASFKLYYKCIFLQEDVSKIIMNSQLFDLIRVTREQTGAVLAGDNSNIRPTQLRWPIEYMLVGCSPNGATNDVDLWHKYTSAKRVQVTDRQMVAPFEGRVDKTKQVVDETPIITKLGIKGHNATLLDDSYEFSFQRKYIPWANASNHFTSFRDAGVVLIPWALSPDRDQPSGHINLTRIREFEMNMTCNVAGSYQIVARAMNFLVTSNGTSILRYSS